MTNILVDFGNAQNIKHLATMIGCDDRLINDLLASETKKEFYIKRHIPKKNKNMRQSGAFREVWEADSLELAKAQKSLLRCFEDYATNKFDGKYPHPSSHGFIPKRSIITNARVHLGSKYLLRLDIHEYFNSISSEALSTFFTNIGLHKDVANGITALTTIDNCLGQGINSSPLFANLMCLDLDEELGQLASEYDCHYTRYADDLAFSGDRNVPPIDRIKSVLRKSGFRLSPDKRKYSKNGQAHFVTGLSISNKNGPFVPKKFKHRLRQELHYAEKYGIKDHSNRTNYFSVMQCINSIDGRINFLKSVEPNLGFKLRALWYEILSKEDLSPDYQYAVKRVLDFPKNSGRSNKSVNYF
jgi:RNA-directed DNA polymerase